MVARGGAVLAGRSRHRLGPQLRGAGLTDDSRVAGVLPWRPRTHELWRCSPPCAGRTKTGPPRRGRPTPEQGDGRAESSSGSRLVSRSAAGPGWVGSRCPSRPRPRRTQPRAPAEQGGLNVPAPGCAEAAQT